MVVEAYKTRQCRNWAMAIGFVPGLIDGHAVAHPRTGSSKGAGYRPDPIQPGNKTHDFQPVAPLANFYYNCSTTFVEASPAMAKRPDITLSELQIALMRVLWRRGETSTAEVAAELAEARGLKHTTVATLLTRLEKRGVVALRRDNRQLFYRALVDEADVRRSMVADLIGALFAGDAQELVAHLVHESEIAPGDLAKVKRRLARGDRDAK